MENNSHSKPHRRVFRHFGGINAEAPLWILVPRAAGAILLSDLLIALIFWLALGELNAFVFGFVVFLTVFQILAIVGLRFQDRYDLHATKKLKNDWIDKIGGFWLVSCFFGPLFGWITGSFAAEFSRFEIHLLFAAVFLSCALPVLTMLPMVRYIEARIAHIQIPLLVFVTALSVLVGFGHFLRLWRLLFF